MECVYLIKSGNFYKIGSTKNLNRRLTQFKTGNPKIEVIHIWDNLQIDIRSWEKRLHKILWEFRVKDRKEWYRFNAREIEIIKNLKP